MIYKMLSFLIKPLVNTGIGKIPVVAWIYRFLMPYLIKNKSIDCGSFQMQVALGKRVSDIVTMLMLKGKYEPATTSVFKNLLSPGGVVVDVGANVGYFSMLARSIVGPNGKVFAFEPEPNNIKALRQNIYLNKFENVYPYPIALNSRKGITEFYTSVDDSRHSLIKSKYHNSTVTVTMDKLDNLGPFHINLLKVDTGGSELEVLKGAENTIHVSPQINIIIEVSLEGTHSVRDLWDYLKFLGMQFFYIIDDSNETVTECHDSFQAEQACNNPGMYVNLLCSRNNLIKDVLEF
jgi:FkbM family methyltransferase